MHIKERYGKLALVAGASEGIGAAFSEYLASSGMDLVLIARRKEPLEKLAATLSDKYRIEADIICCDLSHHDAVRNISDSIGNKEINMVVYNAALSHIGPFESSSIENDIQIAYANMITPMTMLKLFGKPMLDKGKGAMILMASLAGFQGSGFITAYAATKSFNIVLAESLWYEWKNRGVDVIACCAGATSTDNYIRSKPEKSGFLAPRVQNPQEVVEACFKKLGKTPSIIVGRGNRLANFIMLKLLSRKMAVNIMGDNTRRIYRL